MIQSKKFFALLIFLACGLCFFGCQKAYYAAWETLGKEKRHLLKDQVEAVQDDQKEVAETFEDALTRIKTLYGSPDTDLENLYNKLSGDLDDCETRAADLKKRMENVDAIGSDLFTEWEAEIAEMQNASLRSKSRVTLASAKQRFAALQKTMRQAEARMDPALQSLKDHVLFLKHNLNAQAIGVLKNEAGDIEVQVQALISDLNKSISEAQSFIKTLD